MAALRHYHRTLPRRARHTLALALALTASACGDAAQPAVRATARHLDASWSAPTPLLVGNWLRNPGFEAGTVDWGKIGGDKSVGFDVASEPVHSGGAAAYLPAIWEPGISERPVSLISAAQEVSPARFPDRIAGWYRVERWEDTPGRGTLQLQVLVVAIGDPRTLELVAAQHPEAEAPPAELSNLQLRYQLAGSSSELERGSNVKLIAVGEGAPPLETWVRFEQPVRADFERLWGTVPQAYDRLRVMFGVRWDGKPAGAALRADVYYDDLFFGFDDLPPRRADPPQR